MSLKKAIYLSWDGLTDPLGQSQVLPYLSELKKLGHKIRIITCDKPALFQKNKTEIQNIVDQSGLEWFSTKYQSSPRGFSTLFNLYRFYRLTNEQIQKNKPDMIHCRGYMSAILGMWFKKIYGIPYIFDMRGFWADEKAEGGLWNLKNPVYRFVYFLFKKLEKDLIERADAIVSLTEAARVEIGNWNLKVNAEISVIPCCANLDHFDHLSYSEGGQIKSEVGFAQNDKILVYLGSLGSCYMLDEMLDFYIQLMNSDETFKFLIVTPPGYENLIAESMKKKNLKSDVLKVVNSSYKDVPKYLSSADLSISFIRPTFAKTASSPTKIGELLGMGIPVVSNSGIGDLDKLFRENECGFIVSKFDDASYKSVVQQIVITGGKSKSVLSQVAEKEFSLLNGVQTYHKIYSNL